jgi:hypothetical protein
MNEKFDQLRAELARQDAELAAVTRQLDELAEGGVALDIPTEFFEAFDDVCEPRRTASAIHFNAVRA